MGTFEVTTKDLEVKEVEARVLVVIRSKDNRLGNDWQGTAKPERVLT